MTRFSIEFNYRGTFVRGVTLQYIGGKQEIVDKIDCDEMSMLEIQDMLSEMGVMKWKTLQFCDPTLDLETGLRSLITDTDVLTMVGCLDDKLYVKIYVECDMEEDVAEHHGDSSCDETEGGILVDLAQNYEIVVPLDSGSYDEQLHSINGSEADKSDPWPEYTSASTDIELGMTFGLLEEIKKMVVDYAITNGYNVRFVKNEKKVRLTTICAYGCKWRMHASKMHDEVTYQIKTYNKVHSCARVMESIHDTADWVVQKYQERFRSHLDWQIPSIIETVRQEFNVNISPSLAYRARCKARKLNDGSAVDQYKLLWSYAEEIRRTNPGSSFFVNLERVTEDSDPTFQRAYMSFNACKQGLLAGGRPVICLDGCHLKGHCPVHILTAVGIDGNDGIYPIAVAFVESECIDSWNWFFELLLLDLGINNGGTGWTFMSDKQKGLVDTMERFAPGAEVRYCVHHLYVNFKLKFRGKIYKDAMMNASRATTQYEFEKELKKLSFIDRAAYTYLRNLRPEFWAKHAFSHVPKCDMTLNNLSESFNALLLPARDKPIITMLEIIRKLLMTRIAKRHRTMQDATGLLCPRVQKKLNKLINGSRKWSPMPAGGDRFEVSDPTVTYIVDLANNTCTCYSWGLTGIPCVHAIPCLMYVRRNIEEYVHRCYHRETYLTMYGHFMHPLNGREVWPSTDMDDIKPPIVRRRPGRPKKKRVRDVDEPKSSTAVSKKNKKYVAMCRTCHEVEHNARTCTGVRTIGPDAVHVASTSSAAITHSQTCSTARSTKRTTATFMGFNNPTNDGTQGSTYGRRRTSGRRGRGRAR